MRFHFALASFKSHCRKLIVSRFFPGFLGRSAISVQIGVLWKSSEWKHPKYVVKQQSEGDCKLTHAGEVLAQSACLSLRMHAAKDELFVRLRRCFPVEVILTPVMLIIGKRMNCLNKTGFNYAWMPISLEINLSDSHSKSSVILWISITLSFYLKLYSKSNQRQQGNWSWCLSEHWKWV